MEKLKIINGNGLRQMYEMQKVLAREYMIIENLPEFPLDLNDKSNQRILKSYVGRIIEEMVEAYDCLNNALGEASSNNVIKARKYIREYNVEISDVVHFLLELLIYSGIDYEDLDEMVQNYLKNNGLINLYREGNLLGTLIGLGYFLNFSNDLYIKDTLKFHIFSQHEAMENPEISGGRKISQGTVELHAKFFWGVTCHLKMAIHELKNKDWKQTDYKVNESAYYERLLWGVVELFQYFEVAGITELGLFQSYVAKNNINLERIKSGY